MGSNSPACLDWLISSSGSATTNTTTPDSSGTSATSSPATVTFSGPVTQAEPTPEQAKAVAENVLKIVEVIIGAKHDGKPEAQDQENMSMPN